METKILLEKLITDKNLSPAETEAFFSSVLSGDLEPVQIAAIVTALRMKGETSEEILGFVRAMRSHMIPVDAPNAIDLCGTGGDSKGTFNISTAASFVVCAAGVPVAKHGSKAVSSNSGSADVLGALGVNVILSPDQAAEVFQKVGLVFLFAPLYHPAMKHVAGIRKSLGIRTVFNLLGPFSNPASVKKQVIGVPNKMIAETVAETATHLGYEHLLIVTSDDGLDEVSIFAPTHYYEITGTTKKKKRFDPQKYGFGTGSLSEILGADSAENAKSLLEIFSGVKNAKRDIVVVNSGFALYTAGAVSTIVKGIALSEEMIDSGKAQSVLESLRKETQKYGK